MKTIAIDFETANEQRSSACSVGLAWIEDGQVVRVEERFIRPKTMRFSSFNIAIHGIRPEHVEDAGEITPADLAGAETIGLAAGASTPEEAIVEVFNQIHKLKGIPGAATRLEDIPTYKEESC